MVVQDTDRNIEDNFNDYICHDRKNCGKNHFNSIPLDIKNQLSEDIAEEIKNFKTLFPSLMPRRKRALIESGIQQGLFVKYYDKNISIPLIKPRKIPYIGRITGAEMVDLHKFLTDCVDDVE